jgi:hypothetical protein
VDRQDYLPRTPETGSSMPARPVQERQHRKWDEFLFWSAAIAVTIFSGGVIIFMSRLH